MSDEMIELILEDAEDSMTGAVAHAKQAFSGVRTGRATPVLVEKMPIDYHGATVPLQQIASFSVPEARLLVITPFDKTVIESIERSIRESDLGLSPSTDGVVIRLGFPPLTEERRRDLIKVVRGMAEDGRIADSTVFLDNMNLMAQAGAELRSRGLDVRTVFISVDPERDTPEVMADFTDNLDGDMLGLTGSVEQVTAAAQAYRVYFQKAEGDDPEFYLMDHSAFTYLMAPGEGFLQVFRRGDGPEKMIEQIRSAKHKGDSLGLTTQCRRKGSLC